MSSFYVTFKLNKLGKKVLLEEYLFLLLSRPEFDRYARRDSWGSAREYFYFDNMCEVNIELPPIQIQKNMWPFIIRCVKTRRTMREG